MSRATIRVLILVPVLLLVLVVLYFVLRPDSPASDSSPEASGIRLQEKTFDVAIEEGTMTPDEITVDEGDLVKLQITSDSPLELHLHGYDLSEEIEPDEPAELSFDATITGRFEIEDEQKHEELGVLLVQPR